MEPLRRDGEFPRQKIVLLPSDPYLAFLIRSEFSTVEVAESEGTESPFEFSPDLIIADLDLASPPRRIDIPVIGIVDSANARRTGTAHAVDTVLLRPFLPQELFHLIRRHLNIGDSRSGSPGTHQLRFDWIGYLRLASVAIAAVLQTVSPVQKFRAILLGIAFVYAGIRLIPMVRDARWPLPMDVLLGTLLLASTGGRESPYLGFGLVAALGSGMGMGWVFGVGGGLIIAASGLTQLMAEFERGSATSSLTWVTLFPLLGLVGGLLSKISSQGDPRGTALLAEANRVLSTLYSIARAMPGSLEAGSVAASTMEKLQIVLKSPAGGIILKHPGGLALAGAHGWSGELSESETIDLMKRGEGGFGVFPGQRLPVALSHQDCWMFCPVGAVPRRIGVLFAACPDHADHEINRTYMGHLADELEVGLENADLFARVRELSVDGERRRLAGDLHDGVAQALTHVRFELDHLAKTDSSTKEMRDQASRLARVAGRALGDVRQTISGLRDAPSSEGIAQALRVYLRDFTSPDGPAIDLRVTGEPRLNALEEAELFRITQEAVSNAVRHSMATKVDVHLDATGMNVILVVRDDGVGIPRDGVNGSGLGLRLMKERASRMGARLSIGPGPKGEGTMLEVVLPSLDVRSETGNRG